LIYPKPLDAEYADFLFQAAKLIHVQVKKGKKVLVYSQSGYSKAPSLILFYLTLYMHVRGLKEAN
jgi:protein-tyrosine phosphatase